MNKQVIELDSGHVIIIDVKIVDRSKVDQDYKMSLEVIYDIFKATFEIELKTPNRTKEYAFPRHMFCYIANKIYRHSLTKVGRMIERDHTSVIYSCKTYADLMTTKNEEMMHYYLKVYEKFPVNINPAK